MSTQLSQRIGIWVIAIVLTLGTLGSFFVMALSVQNQNSDQAKLQKQYADYLEQQKPVALTGYSARSFDKSSVAELKVETLVQGEGDTVKSTDSINSSYFGWLSDGTIFDSSTKKTTADSPITFSLGGVISGWTQGLTGVKVGSTVRLTIPSSMAYKETGDSSGKIGPNEPLEFIVIIHKIDNTGA